MEVVQMLATVMEHRGKAGMMGMNARATISGRAEVLGTHVGMLLTWPWEHDYMTYGVFSDVANAC